jgi:transposase-like protein
MIAKKKARIFSPEFKLKIVERMLAGEGTSTLAREIKARRKLLYEWKDDYISGGPGALRTRGRPRKYRILEEKPAAATERAELLQARKQITELERKVGHQQMQIDFFVEALRRLKEIEGKQEDGSSQNSTISCKIKCSKED